MAEDELPIVITAIADAQSEGFVASGLFAQGWSVVYRALDTNSLRKYLASNPDIAKSALLLYTPELPELNPASCFELSGMVKQSIGFSNDLEKYKEYPGLYEIPKDLTELVSLVRGSIRSPLIRQHLPIQHLARRAQVIAIGSAGSGVGCTTVAINIAMELSVLEKSTLLIDANFRAPSIAVLLSLRNLLSDEGWRSVAPQLSISEITQLRSGSIDELMARALDEFDQIIIDLGSISGLSNRLTDQRWTSRMTTWSCDNADELWIVSKPDLLGAHRLDQVLPLLEKTAMRAKLGFLLNMKSQGKKGDGEESRFLTSITPLRPGSMRVIARDGRSVQASEEARSTLIEANERSPLRKSLAKIASELVR
jgi:Mrp family chromosome partitioning ATPase